MRQTYASLLVTKATVGVKGDARGGRLTDDSHALVARVEEIAFTYIHHLQ